MESLDSVLDLLDFTLDCDGVDEKGEHQLDPDGEEELEWLTNKDAFPSIETCYGIFAENPPQVVSDSNANANANANINKSSKDENGLFFAPNFPVEMKKSRVGRKRRVNYGELLKVKSKELGGRRCLHCEASTTPQWRRGPMGPKTLCNACGMRFKSGRLLPEYRPANSPTFSTALHSNSHRMVVQIRTNKLTPLHGEGGDQL